MPLPLSVNVSPPTSVSFPDGSTPALLGGKSGEAVVSELHGKYYAAASRGRVFMATTLIAGITIPVNTATSATYAIFNPAGSGVNVEFISLDIGWPAAATSVVATILGTLLTVLPTATTAGQIYQMPFTGVTGGSAAAFYTAATVTASTIHTALLNVTSTADAMTASHYDFDGRLILKPGTGMMLTSTPVQTGVSMPTMYWAEFPV